MRIMKNKIITFIALPLLLFFILSMLIFSGMKLATANEQTTAYTSAELAKKAVEFIYDKYNAGENIDGYTAYVLTLAGEDLSSEKWSRNGKTLRAEIENLSDLLGDSNSLIKYIYSTQNDDGSFGPYANEYGTKVPLQALATVKNDLTVSSEVYNQVQKSINNSISFFKTKYKNGSISYAVNGWNFDYRCVEALAKADEDLSVGDWVYNDTSLKAIIIASANSTANAIIANPSVKDAVYLAKELTALYAVDHASPNINILANAITDKQNADGSFGANIFDHIMVLKAIGKAGKIGDIDQATAFNYIDNLKKIHKNSWGQDAGVAWGSDYTTGFEEADTTAQVLTALSYFSEANNESSNVYKTIQSGLTYLNDVQDIDTAAIIRTDGDSTFSTSETLLALKSLGKTFDQYAGIGSEWVKKSRTKIVAQCLLALNQWQDTTHRDRLVSLLTGRQITIDQGKGSFENSIYSDMWAYIALGEASKINELNTDNAKTYLLSKQNADGSWGETFDNIYLPDFLSTVQAVRALNYLPEVGDTSIQAAVNNGLIYLKNHQKNDGGVYAKDDDPVIDNSELIVTLSKLDKDPESTEWTITVEGKMVNPVSYLMNYTMNADGSFGASKNIYGATVALYAYVLHKDLIQDGNPGPGGGASDNQCSVNVAVVGQSEELLFGQSSVILTKSSKYGLTALGALDATGLSYTDDGGFVKIIEGQSESGMNGWMYKVNNAVPSMIASSKAVKEGDKVIWWYSNDMNSTGPSWDSLSKGTTVGGSGQLGAVSQLNFREQNKNLPAALQVSEDTLTALEKLEQLLGLKEKSLEAGVSSEAVRNIVVVGSGQSLNLASLKSLKKELAQNAVALTQKVEAVRGATLTDTKAELALCVPAKALSRDIEITVKETVADRTAGSQLQSNIPTGFRQVSAVYDFGPEGTSFSEPVTLILKVVIPQLFKPENLTLARYDKATGKWVSVPAVLDKDKGLILANLQHFSQYSVFAKETFIAFADVTQASFGWAKANIETLAGAEIVAGVDGAHFEPSREVTRAEVTGLLVKALGLPTDASAVSTFKDVKAKDWYAGVVTAACEAGLVKGYEDGTFRPDSTVTREELAVMLVRAMKSETIEPENTEPENIKPVIAEQESMEQESTESDASKQRVTERELTFTDSNRIASWAETSVTTASLQGLIKGFPDGTFRPEVTAGRAECAVMVYRMLTND